MAIDTIKVSDGAIPTKPFPFTHTATKTTTHSGNLIIEIIFSSDTSNANTIKEAVEDEEADEDAGSGHDYDDNSSEEESDEEEEEGVDDDESDGSARDSDSEEEYDDEDDEEDEEEEDGSEDFGTGFDSDNDDLIIDFGASGDDHQDGLVVEFEEMSMDEQEDVPTPPAPKANPIPFWFTHEEQDQIKMIFGSYAKTLNIEEQRKACIRSPAPFIGRIIRTPLKPADEPFNYNNNYNNNNNNYNNNNNKQDNKVFKTLDRVEVYLRELYPLGTILPLSRVAWLITEWDSLEGIPLHSVELVKSAKKSMHKRAMTNQTSTLFCAPIFRTKEDYQFSVSSSPSSYSSSYSSSSSSSPSPSPSSPTPFSLNLASPPPLMYASSSSTNTSISRISPFLPQHCRVITFSLD